MTTRLIRRRRFTLLLLLLAIAATPRPGTAGPFAPAPTVLGYTGAITVNSPEVLAPGQGRVGLMAYGASGSVGNRVDILLGEDPAADALTQIRWAVAVGLPARIEAAVTAPYVNVQANDVSTDGVGDTTLSVKHRVWNQRGWRPALAASATWVGETADKLEIGSVSTNGYLATLSGELDLASGEHRWSVVTELGGFWRDPGRPESDSALVYGVAVVVPLGRAGLLEDAGELQLIAEASGTSARRSAAHEPDDALSFVPGIRFLADSWGVTAGVVVTNFERTGKESGAGGLVDVYVTF
ncbi:MAG: hypothetical protein ACOYXR_03890 [Nitrospirota bacterium]